jgi:uncharacterized protein
MPGVGYLALSVSVVALSAALGYVVAEPLIHPRPATAVVIQRPMQTMDVDPSWIKSGAPRFMVSESSRLPHARVTTGLWSCDGPALFEWRFGTDETVHILEGEVEIAYLGKRFTLVAGDTAFFMAGTRADWHVPNRVYKSFTLHDPGRLAHWVRWITAPRAAVHGAPALH